MAIFGGQLSYIAVTVLAVKLLYGKRSTLSTIILTGLLQYEICALDGMPSVGTRQGEGKQKSQADPLSRRAIARKKRSKTTEKDKVLDLGIAEKILQVPLSQEALQDMEFFKCFDNMVFFGALVLVNNAAGVIGQSLFGVPNSLAPVLTAFGALIGIHALAKVEIYSDLTPRNEKWCIGLIAVISTTVALFVLLLLPATVADFRVNAAARGFKTAVNSSFAEIIKELSWTGFNVDLDPLVLVGILAVFSGSVGALLFTAAIRVIRCQQLVQMPPVHLRDHMQFSPVITPVVQAQMLLIIVSCVLWLDPLMEMFDFTGANLQKARAGIFFSWAAVQIGLFRPLMQAFFHSALVQWYNASHMCGKKKDEDLLSRKVQMQVAVNSYLTCKIGVQVLAPAVIGACISLLMLTRGISNIAPPNEGLFPMDLVYCISGFVIWWMSLSWSLYSIMVLSMFRIGLLVT